MREDQHEPRSQAPNLAESYRERARQLARRFAVLEGVVGVALVGGLTLGQADRYSDIDLAVYLRHRTLQTWLLGAAPLPEGPSRYHHTQLDLSYRDFAEEQERDWTPAERWQAATADILYDPEGLIADLFQRKVEPPAAEEGRRIADEFATIEALLGTATPAWLYRGDPIAAHDTLNRAVEHLVRLVFLVNARPVPSDQWLLHLAADLPWRPDDWSERVAAALTVAEPTNTEARRRRHVLDGLARDCWTHIAPEDIEDLAPVEATQYLMLRELATAGEMPLEEFQRRFGSRALIRGPAFDLLTIDRHEHTTVVRFNEARLARIVQRDLGRYLDSQQRVLRRLAAAREG